MYAEVLPTYKPKNVDLTEAEAIRFAIDKSGVKLNWVIPISNVSYDESKDSWSVELELVQEEPLKFEIKDSAK